jgi:ATP-dependent Clp protease ATP-binding subunit ClpC
MYEPFSERARRSVVLAQEEAQRLGNTYIGTEHVLLGIISENENVAAKILEHFNITLTRVRQEVEAIVGRSTRTSNPNLEFTPRSKKVIELAFDEARRLNHNYLGTEHLLLGILDEGHGIAARVITNLGVKPEKLRQYIMRIVTEARSLPTKIDTVNDFKFKLESLIKDITNFNKNKQDDIYKTVAIKLEEAHMWLDKIKFE